LLVCLKSAGQLASSWRSKMKQELGIVVALAFMAVSGLLLWLAQKQIPIGTSHAVWTGIGATGTFLLGALFTGTRPA